MGLYKNSQYQFKKIVKNFNKLHYYIMKMVDIFKILIYKKYIFTQYLDKDFFMIYYKKRVICKKN